MELKQELGLKAKISQKMVQSVSILQMGNLELKEYLQNVMLENPVIELEETRRESSTEEIAGKLQWLEAGDYQNKIYYQQEKESSRELSAPENVELKDYLLEQLLYMDISRKQGRILKYMIQSLDDSGYLKETAEETAYILNVSLGDVRDAKNLLGTMEPVGVGAENLQECLLMQLRQKEKTNLEQEIVEHYLEELGKNQLLKIAKGTKQSMERVLDACERIKGLNPRPSNHFSSRPYKNYVTPDIIVVKLKDYFEILVNDYENPRILVNTYYSDMLKQDSSQETSDYIREKIRQAEWVQNCVQQRNSTLLALSERILCRQMKFFKEGSRYLEPVTQKEVAEELGLNPSTVSRAVKGKYLQCTWGMYPLEYFFTVGIEKEAGTNKEVTAEYIKSRILQIIEKEDKSKPYSDRMIGEKLQETGISISRRTVAKYRESMNIGDALGRKQYGTVH